MKSRGAIRTEAVMGTLVTINIVRTGSEAALDRAFGWFHEIEARCSRFQQTSELRQLTQQVGVPVPASAILFEAARFALSVAQETGGAFDPAMGAYRDIELDAEARTITLRRPLTLDLGAVAKGLAIDAAAQELAPFADFAIDAGGDLYLAGVNPDGAPWTAGIRHPSGDGVIETLCISDRAVCTSGLYERGDHIIDPRSGTPADAAASVTVVSQSAMLADALATAAFVLGPLEGIELLRRMGVEGVIFAPDLRRYATADRPA